MGSSWDFKETVALRLTDLEQALKSCNFLWSNDVFRYMKSAIRLQYGPFSLPFAGAFFFVFLKNLSRNGAEDNELRIDTRSLHIISEYVRWVTRAGQRVKCDFGVIRLMVR
jgi:hypothetical protein